MMTDVATAPRVSFREHSQKTIIRGVKMSHLSIEVGHFYMDELAGDIRSVVERFRRVAPWIDAAAKSVQSGTNTPRVSTCFLIDDYFVHDTDPDKVINTLLTAADKAGVRIDYLARESACARIGDLSVAGLVLSKVQAEPLPGTTGSRPPAQEGGWLSNGRRSGGDTRQAMGDVSWTPPEELGARNHSVFIDIELFKDRDTAAAAGDTAKRLWSCSFLASVWQLLRLGLLRYDGEVLTVPAEKPPGWGGSWAKLPAVIKLNPDAQPFSAYRTLSVLPQNYLPIEHAVRTILGHVTIEEAVLGKARGQAEKEGVALPAKIADRITHVFVEGPPA